MSKATSIFLWYFLATTCLVLFHFNFIHTNRLVESNNVIAYSVSFSLFFLIPLIGLIHLSVLKKEHIPYKRIIKLCFLTAFLGPIWLEISIRFSNDGFTGMEYMGMPFIYLEFYLISYILFTAYYIARSKRPKT